MSFRFIYKRPFDFVQGDCQTERSRSLIVQTKRLKFNSYQ